METFEYYLEKQLSEGMNWVAGAGNNPPHHRHNAHVFRSSFEAEKFCSENLYRMDPEEGSLIDLNYHFHCIHNLLTESRQGKKDNCKPFTSIGRIEDYLKTAGLELEPYTDSVKSCSELAYGRIVLAQRTISILPEHHISSYKIVRHDHSFSALVYELGHSASVLKSYENYAEARSALQSIAKESAKTSKKHMTEFLLVAAFKEAELFLDYEGAPMYNSGIKLASAGCSIGKMEIFDNHHPQQLADLTQKILLKFDANEKRLVQLDDRLSEIAPGNQLRSYWNDGFRSFISERLVTAAKEFRHERTAHPTTRLAIKKKRRGNRPG